MIMKIIFHFSNSQGMYNLRSSRGNYDIMLIFRVVAMSIWSYVATLILIRMPTDGVL